VVDVVAVLCGVAHVVVVGHGVVWCMCVATAFACCFAQRGSCEGKPDGRMVPQVPLFAIDSYIGLLDMHASKPFVMTLDSLKEVCLSYPRSVLRVTIGVPG